MRTRALVSAARRVGVPRLAGARAPCAVLGDAGRVVVRADDDVADIWLGHERREEGVGVGDAVGLDDHPAGTQEPRLSAGTMRGTRSWDMLGIFS